MINAPSLLLNNMKESNKFKVDFIVGTDEEAQSVRQWLINFHHDFLLIESTSCGFHVICSMCYLNTSMLRSIEVDCNLSGLYFVTFF